MKNAKKIKEFYKLHSEPIVTSSREVAFNIAYDRMGITAPHWNKVLLGDDQMFWVVKPVDARKLVELGYEYAE